MYNRPMAEKTARLNVRLSLVNEVGIRALLVHAIHDYARAFYSRFGFEPSPTDRHNLQIVIEDVQASLDWEA